MEKSKKILIINPWSGKIGPNTFLNSLVTGLFSQNFDITILYPCNDDFSIKLLKLGCKVHYVPFLKLEYSSSFFSKVLKYILREIYLFMYLLKFKTRNFNNIIINSELFSFSLFSISKKPNSFIVVHALSFSKSILKSKIIFKIQSFNINKYIAVSKAVKSNLLIKGVKKNIILCYNGVDLHKFKFQKNKKNSNNITKIISIIHPVPIKGAHHLISTLSILKRQNIKFHCSILGWGNNPIDHNYKLKINNLIKKYNLSDMVNFSKYEDVIYSINNSDIMVHPSESESFGFVIAESLALSVPVVAFDVGAIGEIVDNNLSGFLIEPFNIHKMSVAILELINSKSMRSDFGQFGRKKIELMFNSEINIKNLINNHF
jgi:glycosyltransferase involved in cell wall biosynthesis